MATAYQREVFSQVLRQARSDTGLTIRELAAKVGVSSSAVGAWETGDTAPREAVTRRLEQALHMEEGALGRLLGFLPANVQDRAVSSVNDSIAADPRLGPRERELLTTMYRQLVRQRAADLTTTPEQDQEKGQVSPARRRSRSSSSAKSA